MQQGSYAARTDRLVIGGLFSQSGVATPSSFAVTQTSTPSMQLSVAGGNAYIFGTSVANQGVYHVFNDGPITVNVTASSSTNPRIDLVVLRVYDADVSGSLNLAQVEVIPGTPGTSPEAPALPASAIELARVTVGTNVSAITQANISTANRPYALLNPSIQRANETVTSTTRPTDPYPGQTVYESDTSALATWTGSTWSVRDTVWQTAPLVAGFGTTGTRISWGSSPTYQRYMRNGKMLTVQFGFSIVLGAVMGGTAGQPLYISLPAGFTLPSAFTNSTTLAGAYVLGIGSYTPSGGSTQFSFSLRTPGNFNGLVATNSAGGNATSGVWGVGFGVAGTYTTEVQ